MHLHIFHFPFRQSSVNFQFSICKINLWIKMQEKRHFAWQSWLSVYSYTLRSSIPHCEIEAEGIRDQMEIIELEIIIFAFPISPRPTESEGVNPVTHRKSIFKLIDSRKSAHFLPIRAVRLAWSDHRDSNLLEKEANESHALEMSCEYTTSFAQKRIEIQCFSISFTFWIDVTSLQRELIVANHFFSLSKSWIAF